MGQGPASRLSMHNMPRVLAESATMLPTLASTCVQSRYGEESRQRLDVALLHFFQHFRKVYIGEVMMHSSKVYQRLKEVVGIEDHLALLNVILNKVAHNLKVRTIVTQSRLTLRNFTL
jgi:hypothetical protein